MASSPNTAQRNPGTHFPDGTERNLGYAGLVNVFPDVADVAPVDARCVPLQVPHADLARGHDARDSALELFDRAVGVPRL